MKSLISVPVRDQDGTCLGVLNVDSAEFYKVGKFHDAETQRILRLFSKSLGSMVEYIAEMDLDDSNQQ